MKSSPDNPIAAARHRLNMTQADAADAAGIGQSSWCQAESGDRIVGAAAVNLARVVGVEPVVELFRLRLGEKLE